MWIILTKKLPFEDSPPHLSMFWSTWYPPEGEGLMESSVLAARLAWQEETGEEVYPDALVEKRGQPDLFADMLRHYMAGTAGDVIARAGRGGKGVSPRDTQFALIYPSFIRFVEQAEYFRDVSGFRGSCNIPNWWRARRISYNGSDLRVFPHEFNVLEADRMNAYIQSGMFDLVPSSAAAERLLDTILVGEERGIYDAALVDGATEQQAMMVALQMDPSIETSEFPPAVGWYRPKQEILDMLPDPSTIGRLTRVNNERRAAAHARRRDSSKWKQKGTRTGRIHLSKPNIEELDK